MPTQCYGGWCWGNPLYGRVWYCNPDMTIFPCFLFDPDWYIDQELDRWGMTFPFSLFEKKQETTTFKLDDLYDGVFAYHWHGRFSSPEENGSKKQMFRKMHIDEVKRKIPFFDPM